MDSFMNRLAEKLNAEGMIQANRAADIDQKIQQKQQEELVILQAEFDRLRKENAELKNSLESLSAETNDYVHKENVKVYRNVQAALMEESAKQAESIKALSAAVESVREEVEALSARKTPGIAKGILGVGIMAMVLAAASIVLQILSSGLL